MLTTPIEMSETQIAAFKAIIHDNNRPVQPLNGRKLLVNVSRQERQLRMKDKSTLIKYTREELERVPDETDWEKVDTMPDEEVYQDARNDRDAQPTDETFWETAPLPAHFMRIDPDLLK